MSAILAATIYSLAFSICLQGDECIIRQESQHATFQECMLAATTLKQQEPTASAIWCENSQYSSGDSE